VATSTESGETQHAPPRGGLTSRSYLGLLATQFFGAWNDNMFRWLVVPLGKELLAAPGAEHVGKAEAARALSIGLASFVVPYIIFAAPAGYLSDRFSKRSVVVGCKVTEIVVMLLGVAAIWLQSVPMLFVLVFFMGAQSALFGPAKYGSLPEMLRPEKLSAANGILGLSTMAAIVGGAAAGNWLFAVTESSDALRVSVAALALGGVAVAGFLTSLPIVSRPAADRSRVVPWNIARHAYNDLKLLAGNSALLRVALGIAFFWSLASLANLNVDALVVGQFAKEQTDVAPALGVLAVGVGVGSILAGLLSNGKVELGLLPIGGAGIVASTVMLFIHSDSYLVWLTLLGVSGGMFDVPLNAFMQHRSPAGSRGSILAAGNFLTFTGTLIIAGLFYLMLGVWELDPTTIFLIAGLGTIPVLIYVVTLIPFATIRFLVWLAAHTVYRVRVAGHDHLPEQGGALLVANHVTGADGAFLWMSSSRPMRIIAHENYLKSRWIKLLARVAGVIPISDGPKAIHRALATARQALSDGQLVCIFAEGQKTTTGELQPFRRGLIEIVKGSDAPVVPVYLAELWGSVLSRQREQVFWKLPRKWPYPVSIRFGPPIENPSDVEQVRQAVARLAPDGENA
jgi:acyl-[acyl-carrier-protein]-phospholipid O-acyltransferase/long-chain-fatty-acid--[acyl-carrier-protein] ligase